MSFFVYFTAFLKTNYTVGITHQSIQEINRKAEKRNIIGDTCTCIYMYMYVYINCSVCVYVNYSIKFDKYVHIEIILF